MTKKFLILFSLVIVAFSGFSHGVDPSTAAQTGLNFWASKAPATVKDQPSITNSYTVADQSGPLYYIFDVNPQGFVIVSAEDAVKPVLAYSFEGNYKANDQAPAFINWMNQYKSYIVACRAENKQADQSVANAWALYANPVDNNTKAGEKSVNPLVLTKWNQTTYYNYYCPAHASGPDGHCVTGCVATAMAQVMKYWNYPTMGQGSHSYEHPFFGTLSADFGATTYDWAAMTNIANATSKAPISLLMYHCGVSVDMNYSPVESGSQTEYAVDALKYYFNYRSTIASYDKADYTWFEWRKIIMENLDDGKPVLYSGSGSQGGHAWVCDGYQDTSKFHMNWGWGGSNNGYFDLDTLTEFPNGHGIVANIIPENEYYCLAKKTVKDVTRTIGDGSGYSYYRNNTDCDWLIQPDSATSITLNFTVFNTEEGKDFVSVYDGDTTSATLLGTFSGTNVPSSITSTGGSMLITFTSDASNQYQGWEAVYTAATPAGTNEINMENVVLYPNPLTDKLNIHFGNVAGKKVDVKISNITGQIVYSRTLTSVPDNYSIDLSGVDSGIYFVTLTSDQSITCKRIAKE